VLPSYVSAEPYCGIATRTLDTANNTAITIEEDAGNWFVVPTDKSIDAVYEFKVIVAAEGGASLTSGFYYLDVGCHNAVATENTGFDATKIATLDLDSTVASVYAFLAPTIDLGYCFVTTTAIFSEQWEAVDQAGAALLPGDCVQPCLDIDVFSTATVGVITFQVQSTITGGVVT
jgi:hypothetical protein